MTNPKNKSSKSCSFLNSEKVFTYCFFKITNYSSIMQYRYEKTLILGEILKNLLGVEL